MLINSVLRTGSNADLVDGRVELFERLLLHTGREKQQRDECEQFCSHALFPLCLFLMPDSEDRTRRGSHHFFRYTADDQALGARASVGRHDDHVSMLSSR